LPMLPRTRFGTTPEALLRKARKGTVRAIAGFLVRIAAGQSGDFPRVEAPRRIPCFGTAENRFQLDYFQERCILVP
jgi:hypothetical protein